MQVYKFQNRKHIEDWIQRYQMDRALTLKYVWDSVKNWDGC